MQRRSRNFLLVVAILLFLVAAPAIIFWARGYYIDTQRGEVVRTGMILIDTNLPRVKVAVDEQAANTESDPIAVRGLNPGRHRVQLEQEGYATWETELEVKPEMVTRVDNVVLVKSQPKLATLSTGPVGAFSASPNGAYAAYIVSDGQSAGLWLHAASDGEEDRQLLSGKDLAKDVAIGSVDLLRWSEDGKAILVHAGARWWLLAPHVSTPMAIALAYLDNVPPANVQADPSESTTVVYRDDQGILWRWRTAEPKALPEKVASEVLEFYVAPPKIFLVQRLDQKTELKTVDLRVAERKLEPVVEFDAPADSVDLQVALGGGQVAAIAGGKLTVLRQEAGNLRFVEVAQGVDVAHWSDDGDLLVYRIGSEIWAYEVQPLSQDEPSFLVTRLTSPPDGLQWYPDKRHLVVQNPEGDQTTVQLLHISRTAPLLSTLFSAKLTNDQVAFVRRGADSIFVDTNSGELVSASITLGPGD